MSALKALFLLDPDIVFLNHGSFGACPRPVIETYQTWQRTLERQPVAFLGRQAAALLAPARAGLAAYLGVAADHVGYGPNPTTAINMVARSLHLRPTDEILTTDPTIPAHSHGTSVSHVSHTVYEGMDQAVGLDADRIALQRRGRTEGDQQGDGGLWADE